MQTRNLLSLARTITTSALKSTVSSTPFSASSSIWENNQRTNDEIYFSNQRINNLIKTGYLNFALQMFDEMPTHDVVSFNLVIGGHGRYGCAGHALCLYKEMVSQGIRENPSTFSSVLSVCSNGGFHREGLQVHCRVILLGFSSNVFVGSALIDLYVKIGVPDLALRMFDEIPERNLATWNVILRGFSELGYVHKLFGIFGEMRLGGFEANALTLCYVIHGCSVAKSFDEGKQLHCCMIKLGWPESNLFVVNALVDFYSGCGSLIDARRLFEVIPSEDVISWNSIIAVYADNGLSLEALELFSRMQYWGKRPSIRSSLGLLNLSSETQNLQLGEQIHCFASKLGFDQGSIHTQSALINMYGKCGSIERSVSLFEEVPERTLECCNSLMTSLLHCGIVEDVIEMFGLMVDEAVGRDYVTFSTTLKALSSSASASLASCELVHCCVIKSGFEYNIVVSCSLIDAYSKSGYIELSVKIFEQILYPNLICFTSIITGYARNGMGAKALEAFEFLISRGLKPDAITFLSVLTGCSHSGLVEKGLSVFKSMETVHRIQPDRRHYSCMVDLLGRAGLLEEAEELLKLSRTKGDSVMWSSLLRSCRVHRNQEVGKRVAEALMELQPDEPAAYLQASNFYSEIGDTETATRIKEIRMIMDMKREFGYSLIEVKDQVCR